MPAVTTRPDAVLAVAVAVAIVVVACASFGSSSAPNAGSGADADVPDAAEGGAMASDASGIPADSSVTLSDAGCSAIPNAKFCDDFDSEAVLLPKWDGGVNIYGSAQISVDPTDYVSYPNGLHVTVPSNAPVGTSAEAHYAIAGPATTITVDFDFFPDTLGDAESASVLEVEVNPGSLSSTARLSARRSQFVIETLNYADPAHPISIPVLSTGLPLKQWAHVTLTLELSADGNASTVSVDLHGLGDPLIRRPIPIQFPRAPAAVSVGLNDIEASGETWTVWFDNVAISAQ